MGWQLNIFELTIDIYRLILGTLDSYDIYWYYIVK